MKTEPTEVRVRFKLLTGEILDITNQAGEPFDYESEKMTIKEVNEYGMHVEKMTPIACFSTIVCDKKEGGCIIITRPDGSQFMLW